MPTRRETESEEGIRSGVCAPYVARNATIAASRVLSLQKQRIVKIGHTASTEI